MSAQHGYQNLAEPGRNTRGFGRKRYRKNRNRAGKNDRGQRNLLHGGRDIQNRPPVDMDQSQQTDGKKSRYGSTPAVDDGKHRQKAEGGGEQGKQNDGKEHGCRNHAGLAERRG